MRILIITYLVT